MPVKLSKPPLCDLIVDLMCCDRFNKNYKFRAYHVTTAYIRRTERFLDGSRVSTLELGAIEVDERFQHKGFFKKFLKAFEALAMDHGCYVYVESLLNCNLYHYLIRNGYTLQPGTFPANVFKPLETLKKELIK
jgi:GNAT superfamily N-acetyltransferase